MKIETLVVEVVRDVPQIVYGFIHDGQNPLFVVWPQSGSVVSTLSGYDSVGHQFLVLILLPRSFAFPPQRTQLQLQHWLLLNLFLIPLTVLALLIL